jgi:uncharacterized membrane protein
MLFSSLFYRSGSSSKGAGRVRRRARRSPNKARRLSPPWLEPLEDRTVPSGGYVFHGIDDPNAVLTGPGDFAGTFVSGLNDRLQVAGSYTDANGVFHGFLLANGQYVTLPDNPQAGTLPNEGTFPIGIAPLGQIVGFYVDSHGIEHGFLLVGGRYTTIDAPNGVATSADGINASGQIVGWYGDSNDVFHGFLLSGGQYTPLDEPNAGTGAGQGTFCYGINGSGQIVGQYVDANYNGHGFLLSAGQYTTIDDPNAVAANQARGINDAGQIVGSYTDANGQHGYVLSGGQYTTIDDPSPGAADSAASMINNSGQIVGFYDDANEAYHGYEATPIGPPGAPSSPVGQSAAMSTSLPAAGHPNGGTLTPALVGKVQLVASPASFLNAEARVFVPRSVPAPSGEIAGPGLISITLPQGRIRSAVKAAPSADADINVLDQLFANFHAPFPAALGDVPTMEHLK